VGERDPARRRWLRRGAALGAGAGLGVAGVPTGARDLPDSWRTPGEGFSNYGRPVEGGPIRWMAVEPGTSGTGASWTPLHELDGTITPNGLHFERHHAGIPALRADAWRLAVEGLVDAPLSLDLAALRGLPRRSALAFIECAGNSHALWRPEPVQAPVGWLHGLVSCSEWTGVTLATLFERVGVRHTARWLIADGLDAAGMTVSLPLATLPDGAMIALFQNGEPLRAAQGHPARLVLPGLEGVAQVKWLGRLTLADRPVLSRFDTVAYTDLQPDGSSRRFTRTMGVKSVITDPAVGRAVAGGPTGMTEVSGLAWSGAGHIVRVEVTGDGGRHWSDAVLEGTPRHAAFTRFRWAWSSGGRGRPGPHGPRGPRDAAAGPVRLASRATDSAGRVQPDRAALIEEQGHGAYYHYNAVTAIEVAADGRVIHVHLDD